MKRVTDLFASGAWLIVAEPSVLTNGPCLNSRPAPRYSLASGCRIYRAASLLAVAVPAFKLPNNRVEDDSTVPSPLKGTTRTVAIFPPVEEATSILRHKPACNHETDTTDTTHAMLGPMSEWQTRFESRHPFGELVAQQKTHPPHGFFAVIGIS